MQRVTTLDSGKYHIEMDDNGLMTFYRNGEFWPSGQQAFQYAKLVSSMVYRIQELEDELKSKEIQK